MTFSSLAELPSSALGPTGVPSVSLSPIQFTTIPAVATGSIVKGITVFRAGSFKDSKGEKYTWTVADLDTMVENFNDLKAKGLLPNVPVRENHSRDVRLIGGYYSALYREGDKLKADIEFTEPEMLARYNRGTYRSRSIEIGAYESNDGEIYFPTVLGLAFCDIPAVEGLFSAATRAYSGENSPEIRVFSPDNLPDGGGSGEKDGSGQHLAAEAAPVLTGLRQMAQRHVDEPEFTAKIDSIIAEFSALTTPSSVPAPNSVPGDQMDTFKFTLDGREVDVAGDSSTQAILTSYATKVTELGTKVTELSAAVDAARDEIREKAVEQWAHDKKITPAQLDATKAFVKTLSDEQFTAHSAIVTAAPAMKITQEHGASGGDEAETEQAQRIAEYRKTVSMLKFAGVAPDKIAAAPAAKALLALNVPLEV